MNDKEKYIALKAFINGFFAKMDNYVVISKKSVEEFLDSIEISLDNK